ncbi:hypothetical protein B0H19DRAFT_1070794 [Mycena capillaripes]|nr:hypothetical protein B0H19DRAFT_1070794 [Mycena capillaripes]
MASPSSRQDPPLPFLVFPTQVTRLPLADLLRVPLRRAVVRPQNAHDAVKTSDFMWLVPKSKISATSGYLPTPHQDLLIRQEYLNLIGAILWSLHRQRLVAQLKDDFPPSRTMTLRTSPQTLINLAKIYAFPPTPETCPNRLSFPTPLTIGLAVTFTGVEVRSSSLVYQELVGKTIFLAIIFHLRVATGLPTAYMRSANSMVVYTGTQLFKLHNPDLVHVALPINGWILSESNRGFLAPPQEVAESDRFIVQAASPRANPTIWADKLRSSLQSRIPSAPDMHAFFGKYGGSARHVYQDIYNQAPFEHKIDRTAGSLDARSIHDAITNDSPTIAIDDQVGHMLLSVFPLDDLDRRKFQLRSPTQYLEDKLLKQLDANLQIARRELYLINVGVATPGCKATAGDLLDKYHHNFIGLGGTWRLREFHKVSDARSTTAGHTWRASSEDYERLLVANTHLSIIPRPKRSTRRRTAAELHYTPLTLYYWSSEPKFGTYDSFYKDKAHHAFAFQVLDAALPAETLKEGAQIFLEDRGITTTTCIFVSGHRTSPPSILVPVQDEAKFDHFYHLILDYDP